MGISDPPEDTISDSKSKGSPFRSPKFLTELEQLLLRGQECFGSEGQRLTTVEEVIEALIISGKVTGPRIRRLRESALLDPYESLDPDETMELATEDIDDANNSPRPTIPFDDE